MDKREYKKWIDIIRAEHPNSLPASLVEVFKKSYDDWMININVAIRLGEINRYEAAVRLSKNALDNLECKHGLESIDECPICLEYQARGRENMAIVQR